MEPVGLYVHFPFCAGKCPYCDFYSVRGSDAEMDAYTDAVLRDVCAWQSRGRRFDTVYFGGGTPSLLGAQRLVRIAHILRDEPVREFTVECNPSRIEDGLFDALHDAGVTRISMGLQSAVDAERRALGRTADAETVARRVRDAQRAGFSEVSLDLMLGTPAQTADSLSRSVAFCADLGVTHVSAYLLKVEEGTPFFARRDALGLPDEDAVCDLYLQALRELKERGYKQYEISNFAMRGHEGQHNLKYWDCREYIGIGPAAHSFLDGKRFFYPRDTAAFLRGDPAVDDGSGGSFGEYAMLRLRLTEGLTQQGTRARFGFGIPDVVMDRANKLPPTLVQTDADSIRLTPDGFLVSNAVLAEILKDVS